MTPITPRILIWLKKEEKKVEAEIILSLLFNLVISIEKNVNLNM